MVLESGRARSGCQPGWVKALFKAADFSLYLHMVEGVRELFGTSFIRALIIFKRVFYPHDLSTSRRPHLLLSSSLEVRISTYEFGRGTHIQSIAISVPQIIVGIS